MDAPFVVPPEESAAEAIEAIRDELELFDDWMERYQYIIEMGRKLPPFPSVWQDDAHRVPGCQSQVWLEEKAEGDRLYFAGQSDAAIVSGWWPCCCVSIRGAHGQRLQRLTLPSCATSAGAGTLHQPG